jgi:Mechanosensitive ion channel, conserved TM helix
MDSPARDLLSNFTQTLVQYLPSLLAGILLIGVGWFLGWFAKRVIMQLLVIFKLDRLLQKTRWGSQLSSADVRYALYNFVGNIALVIILMIFLNNALSVMNLTVLSHTLEMGILYLPRLVIALLIVGIGWMIAGWVAGAIQRALIKERVPRATLVSRFSKSVLVLFFSTMALTELDIAPEIVVIGFTTIIVTLGAITVVFVARGGKGLVNKVLETFDDDGPAPRKARRKEA